MRVKFWGTRGSMPSPGKHTNRYGGNTSCVEVRLNDQTTIIIDAGTGIRKLGKELMRGAFASGEGTAHLLISHTHWDHIQGLPFFSPFYSRGNRLFVYARQRDDTQLRTVFATQTDDPYFSVPLDAMLADIYFRELIDGASFDIGEAHVSCTRLNHPWVALGYRIAADDKVVAYVSDTAPFRDVLLEHEFIRETPKVGAPLPPEVADKLRRMRDGVVELCRGADLVIFDTMFTRDEYIQRPHWGHSTPEDGVEIARVAGAKQLMLFHHAPERSDDEQDAITAAAQEDARRGLAPGQSPLKVTSAREQMEVEL
jgi:phosphoribosyl 1,2-cyclic phosphodiesterase